MAVLPPANAADAEISFQEGVNGYTGAVDTFIMEVWLVKDTLEDVKRDVDFTRRLIG